MTKYRIVEIAQQDGYSSLYRIERECSFLGWRFWLTETFFDDYNGHPRKYFYDCGYAKLRLEELVEGRRALAAGKSFKKTERVVHELEVAE